MRQQVAAQRRSSSFSKPCARTGSVLFRLLLHTSSARLALVCAGVQARPPSAGGSAGHGAELHRSSSRTADDAASLSVRLQRRPSLAAPPGRHRHASSCYCDVGLPIDRPYLNYQLSSIASNMPALHCMRVPCYNRRMSFDTGTSGTTPQQTPLLAQRIAAEVAKVIVGQQEVLELMLCTYFAQGHLLFEGVPGLAKTLMVKALAVASSTSFNRIQFTPDLLPSDIIGTNVFDIGKSEFRFRQGPVFASFILADEVNRTPPKTQAALLEAMEERRISVDGETHMLPHGFHRLRHAKPRGI